VADPSKVAGAGSAGVGVTRYVNLVTSQRLCSGGGALVMEINVRASKETY